MVATGVSGVSKKMKPSIFAVYICILYACVHARSFPLRVTPWPVARQAPLFMGFFRREYWSGLPFPSPGDLPDLVIEPRSPAFQVDALISELAIKTFYNSILSME